MGLYHSTGSDPLVQVVGPTASSPSQSDFHVGFLRVAKNGQQVSIYLRRPRTPPGGPGKDRGQR